MTPLLRLLVIACGALATAAFAAPFAYVPNEGSASVNAMAVPDGNLKSSNGTIPLMERLAVASLSFNTGTLLPAAATEGTACQQKQHARRL